MLSTNDRGLRTGPGGRTLRRRLSRPTGVISGTRWLFLVLILISLAFVALPTIASQPSIPLALFGAVSIAALAVSGTAGYLSGRKQWWWDVFDACLLIGPAALAPTPAVLFGYVMAMIWFRSLYGTTRAALLRVVLYAGALLVSVQVWAYVPGHGGPMSMVEFVFVVPTMFLTTVAGRHLAGILAEREESAGRDAIHAAAGSQLLGVTDPDDILRIAWLTATELCASTHDLRVLNVVSDGDELRVTACAGDFAVVPTTLPLAVIDTPAQDGSATPATSTLPQLDAAAGAPCAWRCASLTGQREGAWLVIGSTVRVPPHAVETLASFVLQVILAMRNSAAHRKLTVQATRDSLTGLANRALFNLSLASALERNGGARANGDTAVLFVDLDDFKDVNDILGHATGDELLREVASRLRAATRAQDLCARLGGDEFAVLMHRTGAETALEVGHRIVRSVSAPAHLAEGVARVGASVGVALSAADTTAEQIVQRADIAMYAAKAAGKGRVQLFEDGLLRSDSAEQAFDRELLAASQEGQLSVVYQPVVSLADGRCTAVEALARWAHPARGVLEHGDFILAAEQNGAIRDIGAFVLRRACADAADWRRSRPDQSLQVHVKVSALQLDLTFTAFVLGCLKEFSLPPEQLVLEVTETVVIGSPDEVGHLEALAAHGVVIAMDDFGAGYAALTTLRSLPVSVVKIDASFVAGSPFNPDDRAVAEAVVQMASRLGLQTIAKRVERPDQQELFASLGATSAQGCLYLRPTSSTGLTTWLDGREQADPPGDRVVVQLLDRRGASAAGPVV